jgi:hypothetical protein
MRVMQVTFITISLSLDNIEEEILQISPITI